MTPAEAGEFVAEEYRTTNPPGYLPGAGEALGEYVRRYLEAREAAYLDRALEYCHGRGMPVLPALLAHVVDGIARRRNDGEANTGPIRADVKAKAFEHMANLVARGATVRRASEMAAQWTAKVGMPYKASSLEKDYPREGKWLEAHIARELRRRAGDPPELQAEHKAELKAFRGMIDGFRGLPPDSKGERR